MYQGNRQAVTQRNIHWLVLDHDQVTPSEQYSETLDCKKVVVKKIDPEDFARTIQSVQNKYLADEDSGAGVWEGRGTPEYKKMIKENEEYKKEMKNRKQDQQAEQDNSKQEKDDDDKDEFTTQVKNQELKPEQPEQPEETTKTNQTERRAPHSWWSSWFNSFMESIRTKLSWFVSSFKSLFSMNA